MAESTTTLPGTKEETVTPVPPIDTTAVPPVETATVPPVETATVPPEKPVETLDEQIGRLQVEKPHIFLKQEVPTQETLDEQIHRLQLKSRQNYADDVRRGIDSVFIKAFDLPGNMMVEMIDLLMGKHEGPTGITGIEFDKEKYKHGYTKLAQELGILQKPEDRPPVFGVPEGQYSPPSREFKFGEFMGENAIFTILAPLMAKIPYPEVGDLTKWEKVKRFLSGAGKIAVEKPLQTAGIETLAGMGGALGQLYAQKRYPGALLPEFLFTGIGASSSTFLPIRTVWSGMKHIKDLGVDRFGYGSQAMNRAKKRIQDAADNPEEALRSLNDLDQFVPEILNQLSVAERSMDAGLLPVQKAFLEEAAEHEALATHTRWKRIHDTLMELISTPAETNAKITEKHIKDSIKALEELMDTRLAVAREKIAGLILKSKGVMTEPEANKLAKEILEREHEIFRQTDEQLWKEVPKDMKVPAAPIRSALKELLENTRAESGDLLELTADGAKLGDADAIATFIGKMEEKTVHDHVLGTKRKVRTFVSGNWGFEVDLGAIQALRHRLLLEARGVRAGGTPNKYKLALLAKLDEAFLHATGALERKGFHGPLTKEAAAYERALAFTRKFKTKFGQKHIKKLMAVDKQGNIVPAELTLEKMFSGKGPGGASAGKKVVDEFFEAIRNMRIRGQKGEIGTEEVIKEMMGAMEEAIKSRFVYAAAAGEKINKAAAQRFFDSHEHLLAEFPQVHLDLKEATKWNDFNLLKINKFNELRTHLSNDKAAFATIYIKNSPNKVFDELNILKPSQINKELKKLLYAVNKDTSGKAREGLDSAFMLWLMKKTTHVKMSSLEGEFVSGQHLKRLWETPEVQQIAQKLLSKDRYKFMKQTVRTMEALDLARLSHSARGGVFETMPNVMFERLMRGLFLRHAPLPTGGGGSIAAQQLLSSSVRDAIRKHFRTPAIDILNEAFMGGDIELMKMLFTDIISTKKRVFIAKQVNAWLATALYNMGQTAINEDTEE